MKLVLDTNVLISGLKTPGGTCAQILFLVIDGKITLCVDHRIMDEYERVTRDPDLRLDSRAVREILDLIRQTADAVTAGPLPVKLPDPGDLCFLEVASVSGAWLVTGNVRHFPEKERGDVVVLSPRHFLDALARRAGN